MATISNTSNYGVAQGNISNMKMFNMKNGGRKFMVTVATPNGYVSSDGSVGKQFVRTEGYVQADKPNNGVYDCLEVGDRVIIYYTAVNDDYKDANGQQHYGMALRITGVDILESKQAKADRKARKAAEDAAATTNAAMAGTAADNALSEDVPLIFN